jgi:RNA polymerase sigma factor (sigma-70 family)
MSKDVSDTYSVEQLLAEHRWVHRLARSLVGDADDADDLVQETWLAAVRRPPAAGAPARPWLATVARNEAATFGLARRRRKAREAEAERARDPAEVPEDLVASFQVQRVLAELVEGLAEPFRRTLLLRYYGGHSAAEIATMLGVPAGTVRWRLKRALDELRGMLDERTGGKRAVWMAALAPVAGAERTPGVEASPRWVAAAGATLAAVGLVAIALWLHGRGALSDPAGASSSSATGSRAARRPLAFPAGAGRASGMPAGGPAAGSFALHGRVVDTGGRPIRGAAVRAFRQRVSTDPHDGGDERDARPAITGPEGVFALLGLGPGYHNLSASAPGFAVASLVSIDVASRGRIGWIEFTLVRGGAMLAGRVLDAGGGPIAGATVQVDSAERPGQALVPPLWIHGHTITTDVAGGYQVQLTPAAYSVLVRASGYVPRRVRVELGADQARDIHLEPGGSVAGRVVTAHDGQPLPNAEVFAIATGGSPAQPVGNGPRPGAGWWRKPTDEDGRFQVGPLSPGRYIVIARHAGMVGELAAPVRVTPGGADAPIEIAVDSGPTVEGTVRADDRPVAGAIVRLYPAAWTIPDGVPHASTDAAGRFRVGGLLRGEYRLEVPGAEGYARGGGGYGPFSTTLLVQRSMTRNVELPRATRVTGVVLTSAGRPAAQAIVEVRDRERARTDAAGRFAFHGLEPGTLPLVARLGDEATRSTGLALATGQHQEVVLTLAPAARISGTVTWEDGTPAATAPITVLPRAWSLVPDELRSGADGRFSIGGLPAGEVAVGATAPAADPAPPERGTPASAFLTLAAGEHRTDLRLVVSRPAEVSDALCGLPPAPSGRTRRAGK